MNIDILRKLKSNFWLFFILFLSISLNLISIFYYLFKINTLILVISGLVALFLSYLFIHFNTSESSQQVDNQPFSWLERILGGLIIVIFIFLFRILAKSQSFLAIDSPWSFISPLFFILLSLLLILIFLLFYFKNKRSYFFISILYFLFFSISFFVYGIAFGYDQLLHQRALREILKDGFILPKTLYYIGQYSLELFIFKIWPWSLELLDRLLVPVLASILIPATLIFNFKKRDFNFIVWPLIFLLAGISSIFSYTVPQNLSFLFLLILLFFSCNRDFVAVRYNYFFLFSLVLSIGFIHPLSGVPAFLFLVILYVSKFKLLGHRLIKVLAYLGQVLILPLLLLLIGGRFSIGVFDFSSWCLRFLGQENIFLNAVYFFGFNKNILLLILAIAASIFVFKYRRFDLRIYYFNFLALLGAYGLSCLIDFPFLSSVDKSSYANRILILAGLFLVPVLYELSVCLLRKIQIKSVCFKILASILLIIFILSSLYLSYPRKDNYFNSRSFSISSYDLEAVRFIENHKENDNYIVLANQQLGAGAIKEYGFKRYYGPWFYYSNQTGGLPYSYYLKIIAEPKKETAQRLLAELGADSVYLILNDYWWGFDKISQELQVISDQVYDIGSGSIKIFHLK